MLGIFDSGLGGLTVVAPLRAVLPKHDILFFADQAHVPYGDRAPDDLLRLLAGNLHWLQRAGCAAIVMGCNTSCAVAAQHGWPDAGVPVLDLIDSAAGAIQADGFTRVGVIATAATVRSGAYARAIMARVPQARVSEIAAPALVPLVERGEFGAPARAAVAAACAQLPDDVEAVVLGCTHYPLLDEHFAAALGNVARVDPAAAQAARAAELVQRAGIPPGSARLECVTSGELEPFERRVAAIIGERHTSCRISSRTISAGF